LPVIETDASRVEQILVNLLGNAIKHTPGNSVVRLGVRAADHVVFYEIEDEGPGIPESETERIFDVYVTDHGPGIGLGLPLSRRLAQLLRGQLRAVSRPGRGGYFILELPAPLES
jgi:signal transduction histidine kinase